MKYRSKIALAVVGALVAIGGMAAWKLVAEGEPVGVFAFVFRARVSGEAINIDTAVGCYPYEVSIGTPLSSATTYKIRARSFAEDLPSNETLYVAVPDMCSAIPRPGHPRSSVENIDQPVDIVPAVYVADRRDDPARVRIYSSPAGPPKESGIEIVESSVRRIDESEIPELGELASARSDPFLPKVGSEYQWVGIAFLPSYQRLQIKSDWIAQTVDDGSCHLLILSKDGRQALASVDPYAEYLGAYWPHLWRNTPPSLIAPDINSTDEQIDRSRRALQSVRTAELDDGWANIRLSQKGYVDLYRASDFAARGGKPLVKYRVITQANEMEIDNSDAGEERVPIIIKCDDSESYHFPVRLHFSFNVP